MIKAHTGHGFDACRAVRPDNAWQDIQTSTEYVVHALRSIAYRAAPSSRGAS